MASVAFRLTDVDPSATMPGGFRHGGTWWIIPLSKWVITPVINGISRVNPLITGVITHLLSGMNHQVPKFAGWFTCPNPWMDFTGGLPYDKTEYTLII